ncbi:hypothetical protein F3J09_29160 [Bacillus sp. Ab-1751]|uniref:YciI family protein n=1 Tax=Bacillus sp. Ab-1751 TaxID=2608326 RepID=UPI0014245740|nr:hypothetical protein [Bacillus sp. Ab-1751]
MRNLFLELLHEQPSGRVFYGRDSSEKGPDKSGDKNQSDKGKDADNDIMSRHKGLTLTSKTRYDISPEKHLFIAIFKEKSAQFGINPDLLNEHQAYVRQLIEQGKLMAAGAYASGDQGVMLIRAMSLEEAAAIVQADPFFKAGCYAKADIDQVVPALHLK